MTSFHQFNLLAASRGDGLHPKLRALFERSAAAPFSDISIRRDSLIQAGPDPASDAAPSRARVVVFSR